MGRATAPGTRDPFRDQHRARVHRPPQAVRPDPPAGGRRRRRSRRPCSSTRRATTSTTCRCGSRRRGVRPGAAGARPADVDPPARGRARTSRVTVAAYLRRGRGMLAAPRRHGPLEGSPLALQLKRNPPGGREGRGQPRADRRYTARVAPGRPLGAPPAETDLQLPRQEAPVLARIAGELRLAGRTPRDAVTRRPSSYFGGGFRYSMYLEGSTGRRTALEDFLLRTRAGHCEYFATATVLLLRAAGIPARYAVGYAVPGVEPRTRAAISSGPATPTRGRRCRWTAPGATSTRRPPGWADTRHHRRRSGSRSPISRPGPSSCSRAGAGAIRRRRISTTWAGCWCRWWLLLAWRLYSRRRVARGSPGRSVAPRRRRPVAGGDSELYLIEARLRRARARPPAVGAAERVDRARRGPGRARPRSHCRPLEALGLHYRYRFDPDGLSVADRESLRARARSWLDRHPRSRSHADPREILPTRAPRTPCACRSCVHPHSPPLKIRRPRGTDHPGAFRTARQLLGEE